jgi:fructose-1,6-bisphosphatase I
MTTKILTIERHILDTQRQHPSATGEFTSLLYDIALAAKIIARETTRAGLTGITGATDTRNTYGERQQKLDLFADQIIMQLGDLPDRLCAMASEEHEDIIAVPPRFGTGKYILLYDPLDGSSNIEVNASMGMIFAIHKKQSDDRNQGELADALQPGNNLVGAGYIIFGSSTMMVYTTGQGVHGFTLDPGIGEFLLSHSDIRIPAKSRYYSVNQGNQRYWTDGIQQFTHWLQARNPEDADRKPLSHRYIGALVSDFHRNLLRGGIYYYPGEGHGGKMTFGKMRLMFESQALAYIAAQAGGYASDGVGAILDIQPDDLHQVTPLFIGNTDLVQMAERYIRDHDQDWLTAYQDRRRVAD